MDRKKEDIVTNRIETLKNIYDKLDVAIDSLPEQVPDSVKSFLRETVLGNQELKSLFNDLQNNRAPRLLMVGRTGYGKSSIINAICGSYVAQVSAVNTCTSGVETYEVKDGSRVLMEIMDSRGLSESDRIDENLSAEDQLKHDINMFEPDALIFVLNCTTRDDSIDEDIEFVKKIRNDYREYAFLDLPVIVALNKADAVAPIRQTDPKHFSELKLKNIDDIVKRYRNSFLKMQFKVTDIIPISSSIEWGIDGEELSESDIPNLTDSDFAELRMIFDGRYNIDKLRKALEDSIQDSEARAGLKLALKMDECVLHICKQINNSFTAISGVVAASPIPFSDIYILMLLQVFDVFLIQLLSGVQASWESARDFLKSVAGVAGAAHVLRQVARQSIKLMPGPGTAVSSAVAAAGTRAIGEAAIAYYIKDEDFDNIKKSIKRVEISEDDEKGVTIKFNKHPLKEVKDRLEKTINEGQRIKSIEDINSQFEKINPEKRR